MAEPLRVKRLDSPLARNGVVAVEAPPKAEEPVATETNAESVHDGGAPQPPLSAAPAEGPEPEEALSVAAAERLPPPPPLDEPLEFVSGRVPASLAQRLNAMTLALRERQPTRTSQKGLPQQEILAVLLWALGDSDNPAAVNALAELHARYRAGRYAAAAERLASP